MKRSIKFRGLDYKNNWMFGTYYFGVMYPTSFEGHYINDTMINPETIGQFTGLKDRNGTEVYEGDICKSTYGTQRPYEIAFGEFHDSCALEGEEKTTYVGFYTKETTGETSTFGKSIDGTTEYMEVIGNIHSNPELLK